MVNNIRWWCLWTVLCVPLSVFGQDRCLSAAETDLERLYCQIIAEGGGSTLPAQADFNRNTPQVQALLLKRPAERVGLAMPEPEDTPQTNKGSAATPQEKVGAVSTGSSAPAPKSPPEPSGSTRLANCSLDNETIRCPNGVFELAGNQQRSELAEGVLGEDNRLNLAPFTGDRSDEGAVRRYLSNAYDQYIPKMLAIGLGANTMSFTAFHNAFHTLESGGVTFSERMAETYELLKQDRQQLGVKTRYHDKLPEDLAQCGFINRDVLVCDDVGTNWVFVRAAN